MLKSFLLSALLIASVAAFAQSPKHKHKDRSTHHAAMHAEHWVNHHASARHKPAHHYPSKGHKDRSTHHAAMHGEHWLNHHASAPHKHK